MRNVALEDVADNNGEKRHVAALVKQENTIEDSNLEIRGEIPPAVQNQWPKGEIRERSVKLHAVRGLILRCALSICKWIGYNSVVKSQPENLNLSTEGQG